MNKQLIKDLSQDLVDKFELDKKQANNFVEKMFSILQEGLQNEKIVKIKGLGTFKVISVQSRKSIDVNTGEPILIDGRDKISFTPDSDMRDYVNRPFAQFETVAVNDGTDFSLIDKKFEEEEQEETQEKKEKQEEKEGKEEVQEEAQEDYPEEKQDDEQEVVVQGIDKKEPQEISKVSFQDDYLTKVTSVEENTPAHKTPSEVDNAYGQEEALKEEETKTESLTQESKEINQKTKEIDQKQKEIEPKSKRAEQEPKDIEQEAQANDCEQETHTAETEQEAHTTEIEQEVHTATVNISRQFEDENHQLQAANEELRNNFRHQYRLMKGVISFFAIVVLLCFGGGYFLLNQLKKRDHRIEMLEILAYRNNNGLRSPAGNNSSLNAAPSTASQQSKGKQTTGEAKAMDYVQKETKTETKHANNNCVSQPSDSKASGNTQSANGRRNALTSTSNANNLKQKSSETASSKTVSDKEQTSYSKDVRIRTGAYRIVGISHTVKVRSGQTLYSISRANLGPGMECYIEAVNNGKTEFKVGETVNIPKLQIKKRK